MTRPFVAGGGEFRGLPWKSQPSGWQCEDEDVELGDVHPVASLMQGYPMGWASPRLLALPGGVLL